MNDKWYFTSAWWSTYTHTRDQTRVNCNLIFWVLSPGINAAVSCHGVCICCTSPHSRHSNIKSHKHLSFLHFYWIKNRFSFCWEWNENAQHLSIEMKVNIFNKQVNYMQNVKILCIIMTKSVYSHLRLRWHRAYFSPQMFM